MAILQSNSALIDSVMNDLADETIIDVVTPSLSLLAVLLEKGLFSKIAESLQAQFLVLLQTSSPPALLQSISTAEDQSPDATSVVDARTLLIPATTALLVSQGCFAQAAALCFYHLKAHPAFANLEFGLHLLAPYIRENQKILRTYNASFEVLDCAVPQTIGRLYKAMDANFEDCKVYMQHQDIDYFS